MKRNKRIFSAIVSLAMVATSAPMSVFAVNVTALTSITADTSGSIPTNAAITVTGNDLEGTVPTDVFEVAVPTDAAVNAAFKFIMDPEMLIEKTKSDTTNNRYANCSIEPDATLFFENSDSTGTVTGISSTSDALKIYNKSSYDINVELTAELLSITGITLTDDPDFTDDDTTSLYMAIKDAKTATVLRYPDPNDQNTPPAQINTYTAKPDAVITTDATNSKSSATLKAKVQGNADNYEYTVDSNGYYYKLKSSLSSWSASSNNEFETFEFKLKGATNPNADWSELASASPTVSITWNFSKADESDTGNNDDTGNGSGSNNGNGSASSNNMTAYNTPVTLPSNDIASVIAGSGTNTYTCSSSHYSVDGNCNFTVTSAVFNSIVNRYDGTITITFNDGTAPMTITLGAGT